jgi:hypothetical protein
MHEDSHNNAVVTASTPQVKLPVPIYRAVHMDNSNFPGKSYCVSKRTMNADTYLLRSQHGHTEFISTSLYPNAHVGVHGNLLRQCERQHVRRQLKQCNTGLTLGHTVPVTCNTVPTTGTVSTGTG